MLLRMIKFVDWPQEVFASAESPLSICVYEHPRLFRALRAIDATTWHGRSVEVQRLVDLNSSHCHVRVMGAEAVEHWREAGNASGDDHPVPATLLVSDRRNFLQDGGHIRLRLAVDAVSFDINATQAKQDQLHISAELLGVARKVL